MNLLVLFSQHLHLLQRVEYLPVPQFSQATMSGKTKEGLTGEHVAALMITSGVDAGKSLMLAGGDNTIGRGSSCSVELSDDSVSRKHAVIRCRDGKLSVFDLREDRWDFYRRPEHRWYPA